MDEPRPAQRIFYGWWVVVASFVMLAVGSGMVFYMVGVFITALDDQRNIGVGASSTAVAVLFLVSGLAGFGVGSIIARADPRPVIALGAVIVAVSLLLLGRVTEAWQLYPVFALMGLGFAGCSLVPGTTLVTRWFERKRSIALSVASTGLSAGGILLTPLVAALIVDRGLDWATPWMALAVVIGIIPITALLFRPWPAAMNLSPDGDVVIADHGSGGHVTRGWVFADARATRFYRFVLIAYVFVMLSQVGGIQHLFNLIDDRAGTSAAKASIPIVAASSVVGRLLGGWIVTRFDTKTFTAMLIFVQVVALALFAVADGRTALLATTALFGVSVGNLLMLQPLILAETFGVVDYGRIYGFAQLVMTIGVAAGPMLVGLMYESSGGYLPAFLMVSGAAAIGGVLLVAAGSQTAVGNPPPVPAQA